VQLGLERYRGVGIIGFNSPEWFISDLGAIFAGYVFAAVSIIATCLLEVSLEIQMSCTLQNVIFGCIASSSFDSLLFSAVVVVVGITADFVD